MNEQQIRNIVKDEIRKDNSTSRFWLTPVQSHTHDGVNSPPIFQPILTYVGSISHEGIPILFPTGWKVAHTSTGVYTITHGLGQAALYSAVATPYDAGTVVTMTVETPYTAPDTAIFSVYDLAGTPVDNEFFFLFTVVNNRSTQLPTYFGIDV